MKSRIKRSDNLLKYFSVLVFIITITFVFPYKASAYIDPNTGGIFFTSVLPFVYGLLAALVIFWKRILNFIKNIFSRKNGGSDS